MIMASFRSRRFLCFFGAAWACSAPLLFSTFAVAAEWREDVHSALQRRFPEVVELRLTELAPPDKAGCREVEASEVSVQASRLSPRMPVNVIFRCADGEFVRRTAWFSVEARGDVWVAASDMEEGQGVSDSTASVERTDVVSLIRPLWAAGGAYDGFELARPIPAGTALTWSMLRRSPEVRVGEAVEVKVSVGRVVLTTRAVARASGVVGDVVEFVNPSSGDRFRATVTGRGQAEVPL